MAITALQLCGAVAQDEPSETRVPLFACATDAAGRETLAITGRVGSNEQITDLRFTAPDGTVWPNEATRAPRFLMSVSNGVEGYLVELAFGDPQRQFRLFSLTVPPDPADRADTGSSDGGLVVTGADGTRQLAFRCVDRPTVYQGTLHKATECDSTTPLGKAACDILNPPQRLAPLELPAP